jgi:hypothetical protein
MPASVLSLGHVWCFENIVGDYVNVSGGMRRHSGSEARRKPTVCLFGGRLLYGQGVSDLDTLPARLQTLLPDYNVTNAANFIEPEEAGRMFSLMGVMNFKQGDIVVIALEDTDNWLVPFQYRYIGDTLLKLDATSALVPTDILPNNVYTPDANRKIAALLRDKIMDILYASGTK